MKKNITSALMITAIYFASITSAFALTLSVTDITGWQSTVANSSTWYGTLELPKFDNVTDPNYIGYHLASIEATLTGELWGNFNVTRTSGTVNVSAFTFRSDFEFTIPDSLAPYEFAAQQSYSPLPLALNKPHPAQSITVTQSSPVTENFTLSYTDPAILAHFVGTGTYDVPISITSHDLLSFTLSPTGGTSPEQAWLHNTNASINLVYTYEMDQVHTPGTPIPTLVPEPSTLLLIGAGFAGLLVIRRKRT